MNRAVPCWLDDITLQSITISTCWSVLHTLPHWIKTRNCAAADYYANSIMIVIKFAPLAIDTGQADTHRLTAALRRKQQHKHVHSVWHRMSASDLVRWRQLCLVCLQNGFWFSIGWCLAFTIPAVIVSLYLASLYRTSTDYTDKSFDQWVQRLPTHLLTYLLT